MVKKLVNSFFAGDVKDIMTGYRAFSPLFVKTFPILSRGFEIETEMTIHALDKNLNIAEIPVSYRDRPEGSQSKLNTVNDGVKVLFTILKLYKNYRPMPFFMFLSVFLALISGILFFPIFAHFLQMGDVPNFPTLIVSGFIMLAALLCFACGLILDTVTKNERQNFEFKLTIIQMMRRNLDE